MADTNPAPENNRFAVHRAYDGSAIAELDYARWPDVEAMLNLVGGGAPDDETLVSATPGSG